MVSVGSHAKIPLMIMCSKDRQKIHDRKKIQDTNDMVGNKDTGGIAKRDNMQMIKKVRWKDLKNKRKASIQGRCLCLNGVINGKAHF